MVISNISVPLLSMVDAGVLGHLDTPTPLAGVALAGAVFGIMFFSMNFLRMGTTGLTAQALGRADDDALRTTLGQALIVAAGIAGILLALQLPIAAAAWHLMGAGPDVTAAAHRYFAVRVWSAPATLGTFVLIGWFIGLQNTRVPLAIVLVTNLTNVVLDLVLVIGFGLAERGVAAAAVAGEFAGLATGLALVPGVLRGRGGRVDRARLTRLAAYRDFFDVNANLFVRTLALDATFTFFTAQGARFGEVVLAANAILMNLQLLMSFALDGLANAAEALVGEAWGARGRARLQRAVRLSLAWSLAVAAGFSVLFAGFGPQLVAVLTDQASVRAAVATYLPWMILSPLISVFSFLYDGVFVGATWAADMRNIMLASSVLVFLPTWWLARGLDNHGLWLAFTTFMLARGAGMAWTCHRRLNTPPVSAWPAAG